MEHIFKILIPLILFILILIIIYNTNFNEKFYNEIEMSHNLSKQDIINLRKDKT
jgi:hypothetical protein